MHPHRTASTCMSSLKNTFPLFESRLSNKDEKFAYATYFCTWQEPANTCMLIFPAQSTQQSTASRQVTPQSCCTALTSDPRRESRSSRGKKSTIGGGGARLLGSRPKRNGFGPNTCCQLPLHPTSKGFDHSWSATQTGVTFTRWAGRQFIRYVVPNKQTSPCAWR